MRKTESGGYLNKESLGSTGSFIVIEGSDACGKTTQVELLRERLTDAGLQVELFDFPRYDQPSSYYIKRYLNGDYGDIDSISPEVASLFFALERYDASLDIRKAQAEGKFIISNRFVASNAGHQGAKIEDPKMREAFVEWLNDLEFGLLDIPQPDLYLVLDVPYEISAPLLKQRAKEQNQDLDAHESSLKHQENSRQVYEQLCRQWSNIYEKVDCTDQTRQTLLDRQAIADKIWQILTQRLSLQSVRETD